MPKYLVGLYINGDRDPSLTDFFEVDSLYEEPSLEELAQNTLSIGDGLASDYISNQIDWGDNPISKIKIYEIKEIVDPKKLESLLDAKIRSIKAEEQANRKKIIEENERLQYELLKQRFEKQ